MLTIIKITTVSKTNLMIRESPRFVHIYWQQTVLHAMSIDHLHNILSLASVYLFTRHVGQVFHL
jgi:hypothetical protein